MFELKLTINYVIDDDIRIFSYVVIFLIYLSHNVVPFNPRKSKMNSRRVRNFNQCTSCISVEISANRNSIYIQKESFSQNLFI